MLLQHRPCRWVASVFLGFCLALGVGSLLLDSTPRATLEHGASLLFLTILFSLISYGLLFGFTWSHLAVLSGEVKLAGVVFSLVIAGLALLVISPIVPSSAHELEIEATGQRNPLSSGSEIWIWKLTRSNGSSIPASDLVVEGPWSVGQDSLLAKPGTPPASIKWTGRTRGNLIITFGVNHVSGIVLIRWDGQQQSVDLYNDAEWLPKEVVLRDLSSPSVSQILLAIGLHLAETVSLALLVFLLSPWHKIVSLGKDQSLAELKSSVREHS